MDQQLPLAVKMPIEYPQEFEQIHHEQYGLSRHQDPFVTRQLQVAIRSIPPHKEEDLFSDAANDLQKSVKHLYDDIKQGRPTPEFWFGIFGFELNDDVIVPREEMVQANTTDPSESPLHNYDTENLIEGVSLSMLWAYSIEALIVFHSDGKFVDYDYHIPVTVNDFGDQNLNPLDLSDSELAIFLEHEIGCKYAMMYDVVANHNMEADNAIQYHYSSPLTRSLLAHQDLHEKEL